MVQESRGQLLGPKGQPISSAMFKKASPPKLGEAFGARWFDRNSYSSYPGAGLLQFDLSRLTLADYRVMRDHYQINASLSVLSFMMHQLDWKIECDSDRIRKYVQDNMVLIWTQLVRALSQAFWAGYSPNILQWENDVLSKRIALTKIKDMVPEECFVNWKYVEGWAPEDKPRPKIPIYDGIKTLSGAYPIPVDNTFWYPVLIENGDYYGRKLLKPAFTSWYFSILVHLFANRYFERYGEPTVVGRAPYDDVMTVAGTEMSGVSLMLNLIQQLRNRSAVVLPDERSPTGNGAQTDFDYQLEYLESQMRGADFERYLMRLDEEMSLAMFTPLLMLRTADVGSYNLGTQHSLVYMQMLNALAGDWAEYINRYILKRMVDFNFGTNAARAVIIFHKLGNDKLDIVKSVLTTLLQKEQPGLKPDVKQLGEIAGLTLEEVEVIISDPAKPDKTTNPDGEDPASDDSDGGSSSSSNANSGSPTTYRGVREAILVRLESQINKAFRDKTLGAGFAPSLGWRRKLESCLRAEGVSDAVAIATHDRLTAWVTDVASAGLESFASAGDFMDIMKNGIGGILSEVVNAADEA